MKKLITILCLANSLTLFGQVKDYSDMNLSPSEQEVAINFVHTIQSTNEYVKYSDKELIDGKDGLKDVFFNNTINGVRKFEGRVSAVLNRRMLNLKGALEIITEESDLGETVYKTLIDIDGNRIIHGPYLLPVYGNLSFGLYDADGDALTLEKEGSRRNIKQTISFGPKPLTAYILENEIDYRYRIQAIKDENTDQRARRHGTLPVTGPYIAKIEFNAFGISNATIYEILPDGKIRNAGVFDAIVRGMRRF